LTFQVKNSATRNLHRLAAAILFVKLLFERLLSSAQAAAAEAAAAVAADKQDASADGAAAAAAATAEAHITLREAASCAYEAALAPFHTTIVKVGDHGIAQSLEHCCGRTESLPES
jgi:hypothetical protein